MNRNHRYTYRRGRLKPLPQTFRLWLCSLALLLIGTSASFAMAQQADDPVTTDSESETTDPRSNDESAESEDPQEAGESPEIFIPTEEISEDFAVSFPVDI